MYAKTAVASIVGDKRLVAYGVLLLALHLPGALFLYKIANEFDNVPHFWFGFVLSECSNKVGRSVNLHSRLAAWLQNHGGMAFSFRQADFSVRLVGFLLIGGLFWETAELTFSHYFGMPSDPFFAFPITLRNIDGALDVSVGIIGATLAFLISNRKRFQRKDAE